MSIEIEGPYSFKDVDGLVAPVYIYEPGGKKKTVGKVAVKVQGGMTFEVSLVEEHKDVKSASFEVPMRYIYLKDHAPVINWGYNCLTDGVHHGRPEQLWNLPLLQATIMFEFDELKDIVVTRIYNDALQFANHPEMAGFNEGDGNAVKKWAKRVKEAAEKGYDRTLEKQIDELHTYYTSRSWRQDVEGVVERLKKDKLNPHYHPLHGHDTVNLLCRIIGQNAKFTAGPE